MQLEPIRAVLTADSAHFVTGMNRARGSMNDFVTRSGQSTRAMGIMRNGMVSLATQAVGVQGALGRLAQGLLMLGGGGTLVLGVAAGIGLIATAYNALTRDAKEATKANEDLMVSLGKLSAHGRMIQERAALADAQRRLTAALAGTQVEGPEGVTTVRASASEIAQLQREVMERALQLGRTIATALGEVNRQQKEITDAANREADARMRSLMALDKMVVKMQSKELTEAGRLKGLNAEGAVGSKFVTEGMRESLNSLPNKMRYGLEQAGLSENMRDFGISIGRQFAMGMLEGIQSMQDLFKMVIMSILDFALGSLLGSIFPAAGAAAGVKGAAPSASVVGPASMSLSLSGMPSASTPMAAARDAQWQSFLRESVLVAHSQGFRGGK